MGTFLGYFLCVASFLVTFVLAIFSCVKYSSLPDEKKTNLTLVRLIVYPFVANLLYSILLLIMMIFIPHFSWWMILCFFCLLTKVNLKNKLTFFIPQIAIVLLVGFYRDSVTVVFMAFATFCINEFFDWLIKRMIKKNAQQNNKEEKNSTDD